MNTTVSTAAAVCCVFIGAALLLFSFSPPSIKWQYCATSTINGNQKERRGVPLLRWFMILKEQVVLEKTKAESLAEVRHLNLWGEGLTDVSIVAKIPGIEVLALAANQLTTLSPFESCVSLRELYLRKNNIASLSEIRYIKNLPNLRTLWLMDNPCARSPNYRNFVIICCPHLRQLDNVEVTERERDEARKKLSEKAVQEFLECGISKVVVSNSRQPQQQQQQQQLVSRPASAEKRVENQHIKVLGRRLSRGNRELRMGVQHPLNGIETEPSGAPTPDGSPYKTIQTQRAILTAIVSLISELTLDSLEALQKEVRGEMSRKERVVGQRSGGMT